MPNPGSPEGASYWREKIGGTIRDNNRVTALIDGPETLNAMYEALISCILEKDASKARYIYLLGWWLDLELPLLWRKSDASGTDTAETYPLGFEPVQGTSLKDLLLVADSQDVGQSVQVRAMLWDQFGLKNNAEVKFIDGLKHGAAIVDDNTPLAIAFKLGQVSGQLTAQVKDLFVVGSHHQKLLLVRHGDDSLIGFCGGIDLNWDRVKVKDSNTTSHDVHCQITGPAADDLVDVFVQRWLGHPEHVGKDDFKGRLLAPYLRQAPAELTVPTGAQPTLQSVRILRTFNFVSKDKVCAKEYSYREALTKAIKGARRFIYIEDQYFVNFYDISLLTQALEHIQFLLVLTNEARPAKLDPSRDRGHKFDFPSGMYRRRPVVDALLSSRNADRVHIYFRKITPSIPASAYHSYVHAKTWIFDDEVAVIGSANFDRRGWGFQSEVGALVFDLPASVRHPSFAQRLRMRLWSEHLLEDQDQLRNGLTAFKQYWLKSDKGLVVRYDPDSDNEKVSYQEYVKNEENFSYQQYFKMVETEVQRRAFSPSVLPPFGYDGTDLADPPQLPISCRPDPFDRDAK